MPYWKTLSPDENRKRIPKGTGLPVVAINRTHELPSGDILYANERYPLIEVKATKAGFRALVYYRDREYAAIDRKIWVEPGDWRKVQGQNYWVTPVYDLDGNQTNERADV